MAEQITLVKAEAFTAERRKFARDFAALDASSETFAAGDIVTLRKEGFAYEVLDPISTNQHLTTTAGVKLKCLRPRDGYSLMQWGVQPDDVTTTAKAQAAIDALLEMGERFARLPAGNFTFTQLRLYNAAGSTRAQKGKFKLIGAGAMSLPDVYYGTDDGAFFGTRITIEPAVASDDGILLASGDTLQRAGGLEDLTLIYGGTGYAIDARFVPFLELRNVSVRITDAAGAALNVEDCWGGVLDKFQAAADEGLVSTARGVRFSATLFAGNLKIRDSVIENFDINLWFDGGQAFANVIIENTWFQKFGTNGLLCESPIWNLVLRDEYMESDSVSTGYIVIDSAGAVSNFEMDGGFFLGGSSAAAWTTSPLIDLKNVRQAKLSRIKVYRPWSPLVHLHDACMLTIDGVDIQHDAVENLPTGPTYMITAEAGFYPKVLLSRSWITSTSKLEWADETEIALSRIDGDGMHPRGAFSRGLVPVTIGLGAAWTWATTTVRPGSIIVSATEGAAGAAPVAVRTLPATGEEEGAEYLIFNSAASTQDVLIRNAQDATNIATVQPGEVARCFADPVNDQWIIVVSTFVVGP